MIILACSHQEFKNGRLSKKSGSGIPSDFGFNITNFLYSAHMSSFFSQSTSLFDINIAAAEVIKLDLNRARKSTLKKSPLHILISSIPVCQIPNLGLHE